MHGEFLRLLFLQALRETEAHFTAAGMPSQRNHADMFRFRRAAFYQSLKSKVELAAAKAAALRINVDIFSVVAPPMHAPSRAPLLLPSSFHTISLSPNSLVRDGRSSYLVHTSLDLSYLIAHVFYCPPPTTKTSPGVLVTRSPYSPPPPFLQSPFPPRSLVRDGQPVETSPHQLRLVVPHSTCPPLPPSPHAHSFVIGPAVINNNERTQPRLVVSHSTCPPLSPSPHANSFIIDTAVMNKNSRH
jgi:hypothetical protein